MIVRGIERDSYTCKYNSYVGNVCDRIIFYDQQIHSLNEFI